jgi:hypothetical protein
MRGCSSTSRATRVFGLGREEVTAKVFTWWRVGVCLTPSLTSCIYRAGGFQVVGTLEL